MMLDFSAPDVERAVLASLLHSTVPDADGLTADDFSSIGNRKLFEVLGDEPTRDWGVLAEALRRREIENPEVVISEAAEIAPAYTLDSHVDVLRDKRELRELLALARRLGDILRAPDVTSARGASAIDEWSSARLRSSGGKSAMRVGAYLGQLCDAMERRATGEKIGLTTGIRALDDRLGGLMDGDMTVVGGRPGMGKTTLALQIAINVAMHGVPVWICELEMMGVQLCQKALSLVAEIQAKSMRSGRLSPTERQAFSVGCSAVHDLPVWVSDRPGMTTRQIVAEARRMKRREDVGLIVLDHYRLVAAEEKGHDRRITIGQASTAWKGIAKELNLHSIGVAQVRRAESKAHRIGIPDLEDLKECGDIEEDADNVVFVHRPEIYSDKVENDGVVKLKTAKQRMGDVGTDTIIFDKSRVRFISPEDGFCDDGFAIADKQDVDCWEERLP